MENEITRAEYDKARSIVNQYEIDHIEDIMYCHSCQEPISEGQTMCSCGNNLTAENGTLSLKELREWEFKIVEFENKRAAETAYPDTEAGGIVYCGKCGSIKIKHSLTQN